MNKFGMQIERINKIQSPLPISIDKTLLFWIYFSIAFYEYFFNEVFMDIFYYNTQIYREILLQFLQFTEKYYVNRTPFHFRRRAEAVLRRAPCLSEGFSTARPSTPEKSFYTLIWAVLYEKVLACLSTAGRLK